MGKQSFRDPVTNVLVASGFSESNRPGDLAQAESDTFNLAPGQWQWNGAKWVPFTPPPSPDARAFELALHDVFGTDQATLNTLASRFPLFLWSLKIDHNWPAVEAIVKAAIGGAIITQQQYDAIKAAAAAATIPVSL